VSAFGRVPAPYWALGALVAGIAAGERMGPGDGLPILVAAITAASVAAVGARGRTRVALLLIAVALLGGALTQRAMHGLVQWPLALAVNRRADATLSGSLVDDPDGTRFSTRALVRVATARAGNSGWHDAGGRTVLVVADGDAAPWLALLDAGDRVVLRGWLRPLEGYDERYRWRHVVARFDAGAMVAFRSPTGPAARVANALRGIVLRGNASLPPTERALVSGFLLGDTRALPDEVVISFRNAGLSHLLAVSGENVAFALALVGPALRRMPRTARLVVTLVVLGVFGAMTRWEPSVLRASAMAACSVASIHLGRPARATRTLAIAVTALLVFDPFLVHSVGFQLSCGASLGIALLAPGIASRLRGPAWFREGLGTTTAAQLGVAPVLLPVFGSMPIVALPANLLAVPVAGPLTMWGLAAGAVSGLIGRAGRGLTTMLLLPTRLMADGVLGVADAAGRVPLAIDLPTGLVLGAAGVLLVLARPRRMLRRHALVVPPR
jgi:competence protein ComEC